MHSVGYEMKVIENISFFNRNTVTVAQELLGKLLVHEIDGNVLSGIIIETEAYTADDPACHAYRSKTKRNAALFGPVGHAYIYFIYGNHYCMNIVSREKNCPAGGVLIRALKTIDGIEQMQQHRNIADLKNLANGPGKLAQAMCITKKQYGVKLSKETGLYLKEGINVNQKDIKATPRIGISQAQDKLWRFTIDF
jgi:DNA-3-methyladenine glycosylase